jgi:basic amino acid/polyamine antiporter, APA family
VGFGIAVTIGGTIGTGILRKPGIIASYIENPLIIMSCWVLVSIYAYAGVLCAIELGVSLPQAGSWYVYAKRAFGRYVGFITGASSWLGTVAAVGFGAYTMAEYIALLWPRFSPYLAYVAISIISLLTGFHIIGTKIGGKSQEIFSAIKALGLLIFVFLCFFYGGQLDPQIFVEKQSSIQRPALIFGIIAALQAIFYTFDGWHTASYFSEENMDPAANMPRSMKIGVLMVIGIYLLVNLALIYAIPIPVLAGSKLAASDAMFFIFGAATSRWVTFFLMLSILGMLNAQIMFAPRVIYSMSRDGLFFGFVSKINAGGSPYLGILCTSFCSMGLIALGQHICAILSDIATFFFVLSYTLGFGALIALRYKEPDLSRPFKIPFFPVLPYTLIVVSVLFLIGAIFNDLKSSIFALVFLLISFPLFKLTELSRK